MHLAYISKCTIEGNPHEVLDQIYRITDKAQSLNAGRDITGVLLFSGEYFAQVLEGPEDEVRRAYARIQTDARHADCRILFEEFTTQRSFAEWRMQFFSVAPAQLMTLEDRLSEVQRYTNESERPLLSVLESFIAYLERGGELARSA
jgi:hypothetical protein